MPRFTGKNGELRIYDSTSGADLSQAGPIEVQVQNYNSASFVDDTADALSASGSTLQFWTAADGLLYVGAEFPFNVLKIDLTVFASADGGALDVEYYNGSSWANVSDLVDGTASGGNTMQSDGLVKWTEPSDWTANDPPTAGQNLYYVRLGFTSQPGTPPTAELVSPISGQYYKVLFVGMDFNGPIDRARPEQNIALDRGNLNSNAFYYQGPDDPIYEPLDITFSAMVDEAVNRQELLLAIQCGAVATTEWPDAGVSTKGDTQNNGATDNPIFTDSSMKAVNVQIRWLGDSTDWLLTYNEVYFPPEQQQIQESEDPLVMSLTGKVYGTILVDDASGTKIFGNLLT